MHDPITTRRMTSQAYLLRVWRDHAAAPLRATLLTVTTPQQCYHFTQLDDLLSFLTAQTTLPPACQGSNPPVSPAHDPDPWTPGEA